MIAILLEAGLFALLLFIDLFSKGIIMPFFDAHNIVSMPLIDGVLTIEPTENYGASFGIFNGQQGLLIAISVIVICVLFVALVLADEKPRLLRYGVVTIIAGAMGNLVDRIAFGYVRDFIDYTFFQTWFNAPFAVGNIADIFCLVGVLMILIYLLFEYREGDISWRHRRLLLWRNK
ncbi:MAG: signal peptidase II [Clostridia bacterium]|nr:signal peptidase II [Clostridia bacterium]